MSSVTDLTFLKNFCEGDEARIKKYIGMYLNSGPQNIKAIEDALKAGDHSALQKTAHLFKANIKFMGMSASVKLIEQIEQNCLNQNGLEALPAMVNELATQCRQSFTELA